MIIATDLNGKMLGTMKFQYSKYSPLHLEPEYIPKDKKQAEMLIGMYYSKYRMFRYERHVQGITLNVNDENKNSDLQIIENGIEQNIQLTRLSFTNYAERKAVAKQKNLDIAKDISSSVNLPFHINVNIYPKASKDTIPLKKIRNKNAIEKDLTTFLKMNINANINLLNEKKDEPVWVNFESTQLSDFFYVVALVALPPDSFSNFWGVNNIFVNYDFNDVAFDLEDVDKTIDKLYFSKNNGQANILLIWANVFEFATQMKTIIDKLIIKFKNSSFEKVFLFTFQDNVALFHNSMRLWEIKQ